MDLNKLKAQEDEANRLCESWPQSMRLTIFMLLKRGYDCTMDDIDRRRIAQFKNEQEGNPAR